MAHDALEMVTYGHEAGALLFADGETAQARSRAAAEAAGCRILCAEPVEAGPKRLEAQAAADLLLIDVETETPGLAALLELAEEAARNGRFRSVVSAPAALIDLVAAKAPHPDVTHLCGPSDAERVTAIALAALRPEPRLQDVGRRRASALLQQLSEEAGRIANMLAAFEEPRGTSLAESEVAAGDGRSGIEAPAIRALIRARRLRAQYFAEDLFADPAWDMLLDLMAARLEGKRVAVSSLCIAAAVPATTALRWIKLLTEQGLFVRHADPQDGRRVYIELSDDAARAMGAYLAAAQRISPSLI